MYGGHFQQKISVALFYPHWNISTKIFLFSRFCSSFPVYTQNPVQNNVLKLGHTVLYWGLLGKAEGADPQGQEAGCGLVVFCPTLPQLSLQAGSQRIEPCLMLPGNTLTPSDNCRNSHAPAWPGSFSGCTSNRLTWGIPPEELTAHQIQPRWDLWCYQGSTKGWTMEENLTLKIFENWHLFPL